MLNEAVVTGNDEIKVQAGQNNIRILRNRDNWLQYLLNLQISQYQLQICLLRTKIKNRLNRSRKIVTLSYNVV